MQDQIYTTTAPLQSSESQPDRLKPTLTFKSVNNRKDSNTNYFIAEHKLHSLIMKGINNNLASCDDDIDSSFTEIKKEGTSRFYLGKETSSHSVGIAASYYDLSSISSRKAIKSNNFYSFININPRQSLNKEYNSIKNISNSSRRTDGSKIRFSKTLINPKLFSGEQQRLSDISAKKEIKSDIAELINKIHRTLSNEAEEDINLNEEYRCLIRKGHVYDSCSDPDNEIIESGYYIIDPESKFYFYFDLVVFIVTLFTTVFIPIEHTFDINYYLNNFTFCLLELIVNIVFVVDMMLSFFVAFYNEEEELVKDHNIIIVNYLTGWFGLDLICSIPFNIIIAYQFNLNRLNLSDLNFPKALYILTLIRFFKIFKILKQNRLINKFSEDIDSQLKEVVEYIIYFLILCHFLTCFYIICGNLEYPNWMTAINISDKNNIDKYIASLYFNLATIFTIGYGDITSKNIYERIFNVFLLIVGVLIYSFAVTSISNIFKKTDLKNVTFDENKKYLEQINEKFHIPIALYRKVKKHLKYDYYENKIDKNELLNDLPNSIRNKLILTIHEPIVNKFIFFRYFENEDIIVQSLMALKPLSACKNERLIREGDFIEEMIFIKMGVLILEVGIKILTEVVKPEDKLVNNKANSNMHISLSNEEEYYKNLIKYEEQIFLRIIELRRNEHYGDALMLSDRRSPMSVRVKSREAVLFLMNKTDLLRISAMCKKDFENLINKSLHNQSHIDKLIEKTKLNFNQNKKQKILISDKKIKNEFRKIASKHSILTTIIYNTPLNDEKFKFEIIDDKKIFSNEESNRSQSETVNEEISSNTDCIREIITGCVNFSSNRNSSINIHINQNLKPNLCMKCKDYILHLENIIENLTNQKNENKTIATNLVINTENSFTIIASYNFNNLSKSSKKQILENKQDSFTKFVTVQEDPPIKKKKSYYDKFILNINNKPKHSSPDIINKKSKIQNKKSLLDQIKTNIDSKSEVIYPLSDQFKTLVQNVVVKVQTIEYEKHLFINSADKLSKRLTRLENKFKIYARSKTKS